MDCPEESGSEGSEDHNPSNCTRWPEKAAWLPGPFHGSFRRRVNQRGRVVRVHWPLCRAQISSVGRNLLIANLKLSSALHPVWTPQTSPPQNFTPHCSCSSFSISILMSNRPEIETLSRPSAEDSWIFFLLFGQFQYSLRQVLHVIIRHGSPRLERPTHSGLRSQADAPASDGRRHDQKEAANLTPHPRERQGDNIARTAVASKCPRSGSEACGWFAVSRTSQG